MAKGRSKSRSTRVRNQNATQVRSPFSNLPRRITFPSLTTFEDFRRWEPEITDDRYPRTFPRALALSRPSHRRSTFSVRRLSMPRLFNIVSGNLGFTRPSSVVLCHRRSVRQQVMHALGHAGRGGQAKPRYTPNSLIRC